MYFIEPLYGKETIVSKTKARMVKPKPIKNVKKKKIMIVAGHGYNDPGLLVTTLMNVTSLEKCVDNVANYLKDAGHTVKIYGKTRYVSRYGIWSTCR